jgi:eukaryotic-like serine/threonine-protein kinase
MSDDRTRQIHELMVRLTGRPRADMTQTLEVLKHSQPELHSRLTTMLGAEAGQEGHYHPLAEEGWIGRRLGPWMLVRRIGQGGMGEVFLAERADQRFSGQAAIKLVRSGPGKDVLLQRFQSEGSILAQLDHPGIARLLDAGATEEGWPYLVMQYVKGLPIDLYCQRKQLGLNERLGLLMQVGSAVQHAHSMLVIHRDLKPSNILVTDEGQVKLLDFGIAKLIESGGHDGQTHELALTPAYAAPEQVRGEATSTATDVYAMGLLLFEILTGQPALQVDRTSLATMLDSVLNCRIPVPSEVLSGSRHREDRRLARQVRGDLDAIAAKALGREPESRYRSAGELIEDISRFRTGLPVQARGDSPAYLAAKFLSRYRWPLAAFMGLFVAVMAGFGMAVYQAEVARAERERAEQRFDQVRSLAGAMLFDIHDAIEPLPGATRARELVVRHALEYLESLSADAEDDPELLRELAYAWERVGGLQGNPFQSNLGDSRGAHQSYLRALALRETILAAINPEQGEEHRRASRELADSHDRMGEILEWMAQPAEAETHYQSARELRLAVFKAHPDDLQSLRQLAVSDFKLGNLARSRGKLDEARDRFQAALGSFRRILGFDPDDRHASGALSVILNALGDLEGQAERPAEALAAFQESHEIAGKRASAAPEDIDAQRDLMISLSRIGSAHEWLGDHQQALRINLQVREKTEALLQTDRSSRRFQRDLVVADGKLASTYQALGRSARAAEHIVKAIDLLQSMVDEDPANLSLAMELALRLQEASRIADLAGLPAEQREFLQRSVRVLDAVLIEQPDHQRASQVLESIRQQLAGSPETG